MVAPLILLAAALSQPAAPLRPVAAYRPTSSASARATARIRVISGVSFGHGFTNVPASAARRSVKLTDWDGRVSAAELLEFQ